MTTKFGRFIVSSLFLLSFSSQSAFADKPKVMPLSDLKYGTHAIGFSVFRGVEPEPFDVILGNTMDSLGTTYILIRISGQPPSLDTPLENIGAISGMSGSPIFIGCSEYNECIKSGVLVGALSLSIGSFIEGGMNAALTPAVFMLGAKFGGYQSLGNLVTDDNPIKMRDLLIRNFSPASNVGVGSPQDCVERKDADLKPGSMISIIFAGGDMPGAASGTVTWRDGDKIYAFGHPMFGSGLVSYPFNQISVSDTIQSPDKASKIPGCSVGNEGTIVIDASREIGGVVGRKSAMMPLNFNVKIGHDTYKFNEEVTPNSPYTDYIINQFPQIWLKGLIGDTSNLSLSYQGRIVFAGHPEIFFTNTLIADSGPEPLKVLWDRLSFIYKALDNGGKLNGDGLNLDKFEINAQVIGKVKTWTAEKVFWQKEKLLKTNTKAFPGETLILTVILKGFPGGEELKRIDIPVTVPEDFLKGLSSDVPPTIKLVLQGGGQFENKKEQKPVESMADLIGAINEDMNRRPNIVYIQEFNPEKAGSPSEKKTDVGQPKQNQANKALVPKWEKIDPEDVKAISPRDQVKVEIVSLPPLDGYIKMDQTMTINVMANPVTEPEETKKKTKKFLWIFPRFF